MNNLVLITILAKCFCSFIQLSLEKRVTSKGSPWCNILIKVHRCLMLYCDIRSYTCSVYPFVSA